MDELTKQEKSTIYIALAEYVRNTEDFLKSFPNMDIDSKDYFINNIKFAKSVMKKNF